MSLVTEYNAVASINGLGQSLLNYAGQAQWERLYAQQPIYLSAIEQLSKQCATVKLTAQQQSELDDLLAQTQTINHQLLLLSQSHLAQLARGLCHQRQYLKLEVAYGN